MSRLQEQVRGALGIVSRAKRERDGILAELLPEGSSISYRKGDYLIEVTVLSLSGDRIRVCNPETDKTYWISAFAVE